LQGFGIGIKYFDVGRQILDFFSIDLLIDEEQAPDYFTKMFRMLM